MGGVDCRLTARFLAGTRMGLRGSLANAEGKVIGAGEAGR